MKMLLIVLVFLIVGCAHTSDVVPPEKLVVKEVSYVIRVPPAELMTLPEVAPQLNVDEADQADVAEWLLLKEKYTRELENRLKGIASFFVKTQDELNSQAEEENSVARAAAGEANRGLMDEANRRPVIRDAIPMP